MPSDPASRRFEQVVRAYANDLFRYLYWLCRDRALAEDLVQEAFARAWAAWESQRDEKAVKAWLFTIARHEFARLHERKALDVDPEADLEALVARGPSDPSLALDLRKAFALLPATYRDPLLLQVLAGLSSVEIAAALGTTEDNVNARLSRGRKALRALVDGEPASAPALRTNP
ncbi:MAG: sigma-70 family RNA polymerase sigma factor [Betaproteobacteria bacterium]|nr:sigma-70 family RNA polymerase sigma factor [Betaproteobacteria bacterium]